jgi:hypothetical protein
MRLMLTVVQESAASAARLTGDPNGQRAWLEFRNKVEAFRTFEHVDAVLGLPISAPFPQLIARAAALPPPFCVWAAEGIAHHVTAARCAHGGVPRGLLQDDRLPRTLLVPLHAGMGSALAEGVLDRVDPGSHADGELVDRFEAACLANADPEHAGVALEALGFSVQSMYGGLHPFIERDLEVAHPSMLPFFWHGVGRAMYFAPTNCFGSLVDHAGLIDKTLTHIGDRVNAVAGFGWAATLVNLRHPHVIEPLVCAASAMSDSGAACGAGVQSALEIWRSCVPDDPALMGFLSHEPRSSFACRAWESVVNAVPCPRYRQTGDLFAAPGASLLEIRG